MHEVLAVARRVAQVVIAGVIGFGATFPLGEAAA